MNKTRSIYILGILFISLFVVGSSFAQRQPLIKINNNSGEKRKICMYKDVHINLIAKRCFNMNPGESVMWNRGGETSNFKVKIFKKKLIDKYLYARSLPGDTKNILIGKGGRFGYSRDEPKPKKLEYFLKVCNQNYREIYVSLAFEVNNEISSHGWWGIKKKACVNVAVSKLMKSTSKVEFGNFPKTYFYAKEFGAGTSREWTGGDKGKNVCINNKSAFALRQYMPTTDGGLRGISCIGNGLKLHQLREIKKTYLKGSTYYLTF